MQSNDLLSYILTPYRIIYILLSEAVGIGLKSSSESLPSADANKNKVQKWEEKQNEKKNVISLHRANSDPVGIRLVHDVDYRHLYNLGKGRNHRS